MLRVLQVAGAYFPEISAAGVQCRAVAAALRGRVTFSVLATAVNPLLPRAQVVDDVAVYRLPIDAESVASKVAATARSVAFLARARTSFDLVHLHGFSQKNVPVTMMARLLGKPIVLTLHTAGQDEPALIRRRGPIEYRAFRAADLVLSVSPYLSACYERDGLSTDRLRLTPNGIDVERFRPPHPGEREQLRRALGWPATQPVVVFVGFFSRDKRPDLLFRAWQRLVTETGSSATLVYVGATMSRYYEVDSGLAREIRAAAVEAGRSGAVVFVEPTNDVERYLRAADVFVLPSVRETQSLALLEAMSCGLPSIASRLAGATDVFVEDGVNGLLFPVDDEAALAGALRRLLDDPRKAKEMGERGRQTVVTRYDIRDTAEAWLAAYREVVNDQPS